MDISMNNLVDMLLNNMRLNVVMNESLNAPKVQYKKVISAVGLANLRKIKYDNKHECKKCAITMEEFVKDEEIIKLPCKHIFKESSIMNWLTNNSATCPVCRYEFPYREEKILPPPIDLPSPSSFQNQSTDTPPDTPPPLVRMTNRNFITGIMDRLLEFEEEENLQRAIEASLN